MTPRYSFLFSIVQLSSIVLFFKLRMILNLNERSKYSFGSRIELLSIIMFVEISSNCFCTFIVNIDLRSSSNL